MDAFVELVGQLGFPIACVIALGVFAWHMVKHNNETAAKTMERIQSNCAVREEKLYQEIKENREINSKAITTIQMYAERLTHIEKSVDDVKEDLSEIKGRIQ